MYHLIISKSELNIHKILLSGQVFHYHRLCEGFYVLIYENKAVLVHEVFDGYRFFCSKEEFFFVWQGYLDLKRDYEEVNRFILNRDARLSQAITENEGIRILKQSPFEMLISFIISQSKSIPQIMNLIHQLCQNYGEPIELDLLEIDVFDIEPTLCTKLQELKVYSFPKPEVLAQFDEEVFRRMKFGYRAKYLVEASRFAHEKVDLHCLNDLSDEELHNKLLSIHGVGKKVAACVMLFGFSRMESFPVDTWMRKIMLYLYSDVFNGKTQDKQIEAFGKELFGEYAGIAQQYLFEYGRRIMK